MTTALVSEEFIAQFGDAFKAVGESAGKPVSFMTLPEEKGAHIDAHTQEPLPKDAPLWDLPNVIVTPHNASASTGNEGRGAQMFVANFGHWVRGEPMFNVQKM